MTQPVRIYLIRHGRASGGFAEAHDPGLDEVGRTQSELLRAPNTMSVRNTPASNKSPLDPPFCQGGTRNAREDLHELAASFGILLQILNQL